jgi:tetratricopeptide (TPR) repeat protein
MTIFGHPTHKLMLLQDKKIIFSLLLLFFLCPFAFGQTRKYCSELEKKGVEAYQKRDHVKSLEYLTEARAIAEKHHWDIELYNALVDIGNNYYTMFDFGEALNYFLEAYNLAVKKLTPKEEITVLNNIANLYTKEKIYDKAADYYNRVYETAKDKNLESRMGLPLMNLGYIYNLQNQPKKARPYIEKSIPYLKEEVFYASAKVLLIENDMLLGDTKKARDEASAFYKAATQAERNDVEIYLWLIISKSYLKENNFAQAAAFANKFIGNKNLDLDVKRDTYDLLASIYSKSANFKMAATSKDSVIAIDKRINDHKNGRLFENNRVKFEIANYKKQISVKEEKITSERIIFFSVISIITALVVILVLVFRQKRILAERNQHITALDLEREKTNNLLLEQQVTNAVLEQERLKNEVENRNRKLTSKALYLSGRNELIEDFVTYLSKKPRLAKDPTIVNYINNLKNHLKTDNEWDNFIAHFEEVNHGFLNRLKTLHPSLNANDVRFIAYTYMNLSTKEIAFILNITVVACKKRKERIAAKMEIAKNIDLFDYIATL